MFIGIDPGSKGFITVLSESGYSFLAIADSDPQQISSFLHTASMDQFALRCGMICCMEEVHALFGSSAKSTFAFGRIFGFLIGVLTAFRIPYELVPPKVWQKEIWNGYDKVTVTKKSAIRGKEYVRHEIDTKRTSYNAARRIFPDIDLRRKTSCTVFDDNKVDSLLICEYARRRNL